MDRFDTDPRDNYPSPSQEAREFDAWLADEQAKAANRIVAALSDLEEMATADIAAPDCGDLTMRDLERAQYIADKLEWARAGLADALDLLRRARAA